jgi:hypothetical protein
MVDNLSPRQLEQANAFWEISEEQGKWGQGARAEGAHYFDGADNPFIEDGMICENCVFWLPGGQCQIVRGSIDEEGLCKLWIIPDQLLEV